MFSTRIGVEVEFTGITRTKAAEAAAEFLGGRVDAAQRVIAPDGRAWKFVYDASITSQKKVGGQIVAADNEYKVEMVTPILTYREDIDKLERIWYEGYDESRSYHYHGSRYHFLNLHSFFNGNHTVELRGFNSELHAGKIRSYIVLALALNHQALTQKCASSKKPQIENEKFAMRTYLNRIGLIGEEFANCREHLCKHLEGNAAWRFRTAA